MIKFPYVILVLTCCRWKIRHHQKAQNSDVLLFTLICLVVSTYNIVLLFTMNFYLLPAVKIGPYLFMKYICVVIGVNYERAKLAFKY